MGKTYEYEDEQWQTPRRKGRIDDNWKKDKHWEADEDGFEYNSWEEPEDEDEF